MFLVSVVLLSNVYPAARHNSRRAPTLVQVRLQFPCVNVLAIITIVSALTCTLRLNHNIPNMYLYVFLSPANSPSKKVNLLSGR